MVFKVSFNLNDESSKQKMMFSSGNCLPAASLISAASLVSNSLAFIIGNYLALSIRVICSLRNRLTIARTLLLTLDGPKTPFQRFFSFSVQRM